MEPLENPLMGKIGRGTDGKGESKFKFGVLWDVSGQVQNSRLEVES